MDLGLEGARAIITGASRGVGRVIAEELLAEGAAVAVCARGTAGRAERTGTPTPTLDELQASLTADGATALVSSVDVADHAALAGWVGDVAAMWGGIDIVYRIRANAVSPGPILVKGGSWDAIQREKPEYYEEKVARHPLGRLGLASEVARVVTFLASPAASWVTGANVVVDGGFTKRIQC